MGLMATIVTGIVASLIATLFCKELSQWQPAIVRTLIKLASTRFEGDEQARYHEEWSAFVDDIPGDVSKMLAAAGCVVAADQMASTATYLERAIALSALVFLLPLLLVIGSSLVLTGTKVFEKGPGRALWFSRPNNRLGSFLDKSSLYELPVLTSVVLGRISLGLGSLRLWK